MDATSLYLRVFFGARPFTSSGLDSIAESMGTSGLLSQDKGNRYFITPAKNVTAASLGNKVLFGRLYYERLTEKERLAVGAHELAHMLEEGSSRSRTATLSLGISVVLTAIVYLSVHSLLVSEIAFCASFFPLISILSSRDQERRRLEELRCDGVSASLVGGLPLIASIRMAESMLFENARRPSFLRSRKKTSPTADERASAIMALAA
jgi:Zn-dependent protease with chaperone function